MSERERVERLMGKKHRETRDKEGGRERERRGQEEGGGGGRERETDRETEKS